MDESLEMWWTKKYQLPSNHDLFLDRTRYDLLVEFWLDQFEKNPMEAHVNEQGEVQFQDTGDAMIDKWEAKYAEGEVPDLDEAFSEEAMEKLRKYYERKAKNQGEAGISIAEVNDRFSKKQPSSMWKVDPSKDKKAVIPPTFGGFDE